MQSHARGHLLQHPAWASLKSAFGWDVQRLAVRHSPPGEPSVQAESLRSASQVEILAGAQILFRTHYGMSVAYIPRGPLFSGVGAVDDLLLASLEQAARRRRAIFLRFEPNLLECDPDASNYQTWLLRKAFRPVTPIQPRSTIHLDLTPPPDRLLAAMSKGHRADIRRAERLGIITRVGAIHDIPLFYHIMQMTGQRADFGIHTEAYYRRAWELFQPHSRLLFAEQDGQPVAVSMVFRDERCGYYLYSGATEAGLKVGANHLLQWQAVQWAQAQGCSQYDLWGIPDALGRAATVMDEAQRAALTAEAQQDPLIGVYRFKKGFGGQVVRYMPAYDRVFFPPLYALWRRRAG